MKLTEQVALAPYTTFGIGGPARWFVEAATEDDVVEAERFARQQQLPLLVLGGGSNVLVADGGFAGVVLHMGLRGVSFTDDGQLQAAAGEPWDALVQSTVERGMAGMECLAGIPGSVGGTPIQNVGAYGQEVAQTIIGLRAYDLRERRFTELSAAACGFAYRTSLLNTSERGRYIVTRVDFQLRPGGEPTLRYADLERRFAGGPTPSLRNVAEAVREIRRAKGMVVQPGDADTQSAGSFFRNPVVAASRLAEVSRETGVAQDAVPHWPAGDDLVKLPAAWLLERAGFVRGYTLGRAGISNRHTLALTNRGGASAEEMVRLRDRIVATVSERFGIRLEQEPVSVGFDAAPTPE